MISNPRLFLKKYKAEITISILSTFIGIMTPILLENWSQDPWLRILFMLGSVIVFLLFAILFNQKRLSNIRYGQISNIMSNYFGITLHENQYFVRTEHFTEEKRKLAKVFVDKMFPRIAVQISRSHPNISSVNLVLDSGTTITPIFQYLLTRGNPFGDGIKLRIYTNNLAGIDEIHKVDYPELCKLTERDFNLIAGLPLGKYKATTGPETQRYLNALWESSEQTSGKCINLSVITANWFLAGGGLDSISVCARGEGHLEFKENVVNHSHYIILIAPLGKITCLSDVGLLNEIFPNSPDPYKSFQIPERMRDKIFLLTSFRQDGSLSPLLHHSNALELVRRKNDSKNFIFFENSPYFEPPSKKLIEVEAIEIPHKYVRDKKKEFYH